LRPSENWSYQQQAMILPAQFSILAYRFPKKPNSLDVMSLFGVVTKEFLCPAESKSFLGQNESFFGFSLFPLKKFSNNRYSDIFGHSEPNTSFRKVHCQILETGEFQILIPDLGQRSWETIFQVQMKPRYVIVVGAIRTGDVEMVFQT
jgi:hypothetical protein